MNTYRKIQIAAAAVVANGVMALGLLTPGTALANPCPTKCIRMFDCPAATLSFCQSVASSGCTATSAICFSAGVSGLPCVGFGTWDVVCYYN